MNEQKRLSIIIVTYFSEKEIGECLAAVEQFDKNSVEVIIIDNASKDGTIAFLKKHCENNPMYRLYFNDKNVGSAVGITQGFDLAKADIALSINPDTTLSVPGMLTMLDYFEKHPEIGIIGPKITDEHGVAQETYGRDLTPWNELVGKTLESKYLEIFPWITKRKQERLKITEPTEVGWIGGACFMARKSEFLKVGGIHPQYFMSYADMIDLAKKMKNNGFKTVLYAPTSVVHAGGKSSVRDRDAVLRASYIGTLFYFKTYYGWATVLAAKIIYVVTSSIKVLIAFPISLFKKYPYRDIAKAHAKNVFRILTGTLGKIPEYK
jgi:GT2 family glycosyltransferase